MFTGCFEVGPPNLAAFLVYIETSCPLLESRQHSMRCGPEERLIPILLHGEILDLTSKLPWQLRSRCLSHFVSSFMFNLALLTVRGWLWADLHHLPKRVWFSLKILKYLCIVYATAGSV